MHHSDKLYHSSHKLSNTLDWIGSYQHFPDVKKCISDQKYKVVGTQMSNGRQGVMKQIVFEQDHQGLKRKLIRRHIRIDVKRYLKNLHWKPIFQNYQFECLRLVSSEDVFERTQTLFLYQPYFPTSLHNLLEKSLSQAKIVGLIDELLHLFLQGGGLRNIVMSSRNIFLQKDYKTMHINHSALTGLTFLLLDEVEIEKQQLREIFPYLCQNCLKSTRTLDQLYLRAFAINCLTLILGQNAELTYEFDVRQKRRKKALASVNFSQKYEQFLEKHKFQQKIKTFSSKYPYIRNLAKIIDDILTQRKTPTWEGIIECFAQHQSFSESEDQDIQFRQFHHWAWYEEKNQLFFEQRGMSQIKVYVPIKFHGNLREIYKYKNWWEVFLKDGTNHKNFAKNLLEFIRGRLKQSDFSLIIPVLQKCI